MDDIVDIVTMTTFTGYAVHSQCMLGNLAQHCKSRSLPGSQIDIMWAQLMVNQQILDRVTGDQKRMEKRDIVDH